MCRSQVLGVLQREIGLGGGIFICQNMRNFTGRSCLGFADLLLEFSTILLVYNFVPKILLLMEGR